ncbi:hypothetical protein AVEN_127325-1 [Araneus ventricosus]|uniref:Uncharacterized protein n=1 Tax=Araneus ventricosus TaxID=182803 RepID=A0A4Y2JX91_ARAVE|nr:hypothetical protein AVEN_127325-1 [Araneus ventricosus]
MPPEKKRGEKITGILEKNITYILLASLGKGLGTDFSCRFPQSTVSPLQSHTWGQTDIRDSSPVEIPNNNTTTRIVKYIVIPEITQQFSKNEKKKTRRKNSLCMFCCSYHDVSNPCCDICVNGSMLES